MTNQKPNRIKLYYFTWFLLFLCVFIIRSFVHSFGFQLFCFFHSFFINSVVFSPPNNNNFYPKWIDNATESKTKTNEMSLGSAFPLFLSPSSSILSLVYILLFVSIRFLILCVLCMPRAISLPFVGIQQSFYLTIAYTICTIAYAELWPFE